MARKINGLNLKSNFTLYINDLRGNDWRWEIPFKEYFKFKQKIKIKENCYEDFRNFLTLRDRNLIEIVNTLGYEVIGSEWKKDKVELAKLLVDFVHRIPYQERDPTYVKYPIETLCEFGGNCADASVLGATLLQIAKIESCFIDLDDHLAVGINIPYNGESVELHGRKFYYTEMANLSYLNNQKPIGIGENENYDLLKAKVYSTRKNQSKIE